jgi:hypothetical protein
MRLDSAGEIAGFFGMRRTLGLEGGMLIRQSRTGRS